MSKVFFQIGTNTGDDLFRDICMKYKPDIIVLVEPNTELIKDIENNYKGISNIHIFNNAIYYEDNKEVELYIPAIDGVYGNKAENGHTYSHGEFSLLPMNDWGDKKNMIKLIAKTITFDSICQKLNITDIHYLQIDTEGFDSEIIKMIDLNKYNIKEIRFEKWTFPADNYTRYHNEDKEKFGMNGMNFVVEKFKNNGYVLKAKSDKTGNDIVAVKIKK